jgi:hypothetical protein
VLKLDDNVLCPSFTNIKLNKAAQDAYDLAAREIDVGRSVYEWMMGNSRKLWNKNTFGDKFHHMIICKRGLEDGEVKIGNFPYTGIVTEVPEGHDRGCRGKWAKKVKIL